MGRSMKKRYVVRFLREETGWVTESYSGTVSEVVYNIFTIIDNYTQLSIGYEFDTHFNSVGKMPKTYPIRRECKRLNDEHDHYLNEVLAYGES